MGKAAAVLGVGVSGTLLGVLGLYMRDVYKSARFVHQLEKAYGRVDAPPPHLTAALLRVLASDWENLHYPRWAMSVLPRRAARGAGSRFHRLKGLRRRPAS